MAHANVALNFNAFLEKTKLKDDGTNYTDWVCNLRIIFIAAKKAYVLEAPLGEAPIFSSWNISYAPCCSKRVWSPDSKL